MASNLFLYTMETEKMRPSDYSVTLPKEPVYHILKASNMLAAMPTVCFCNPALLFPPCCSSSTPTASNSTTTPQTAVHSSYHNTSRWLPSPLCLTNTFSYLPQASWGLLTPQQGSDGAFISSPRKRESNAGLLTDSEPPGPQG